MKKFLIKDIAKALNIAPEKVSLAKLSLEHHKKSRFIYGYTAPSVRNGKKYPAGFFKVASSKYAKQLQREAAAIQVARKQLHVPTIKIITPFKKMTQKKVILELVFLDFNKEGTLMANNSQVAKAKPLLGTRAAKTLCAFSGQEIPKGVNHLVFKRGDWRNKSPRSFWNKWEKHSQRVMEKKFEEMAEKLIGIKILKQAVQSAKQNLECLLKKEEKSKKRFFVHNDASPTNIFFKHHGQALLLDFEHAGVTRYQTLALMTDLGNFSGRCWPNLKMQQAFLIACLKSKKLGNLEKRYKITKGALVFGTIYLAKYGMGPRQKEHLMSVALLTNLSKTLPIIEKAYQELKKQP